MRLRDSIKKKSGFMLFMRTFQYRNIGTKCEGLTSKHEERGRKKDEETMVDKTRTTTNQSYS